MSSNVIMLTKKSLQFLGFQRFFHVSSVNYTITKKQGAKLCKMLNPKMQRKWHPAFTEANTLPSVKSLTKVKHEAGNKGIRRIAVLNKLFMKSITDIMSTGSSSINIVGRGIEISKVTVSPDLQRVNVFWVCKGDTRDDEIEALLSKLAGPLRHELSTLRLMGEVPYIIFVKDRQEAHLVDLDRRLSLADYGEDYTPTELGHLLKSEFTLDTKLSPEMKAKIKQLEDTQPSEEEPVPEMTHNVFGLDHKKIMDRLLAARKRSRDAWSNIDEDNNVITYRAPAQVAAQVDTKKQKQELADFLQRRQIEQNKLHKELMNARALEVQLDKTNEDDDEEYYLSDDDFEDYEYDEELDSTQYKDNGRLL